MEKETLPDNARMHPLDLPVDTPYRFRRRAARCEVTRQTASASRRVASTSTAYHFATPARGRCSISINAGRISSLVYNTPVGSRSNRSRRSASSVVLADSSLSCAAAAPAAVRAHSDHSLPAADRFPLLLPFRQGLIDRIRPDHIVPSLWPNADRRVTIEAPESMMARHPVETIAVSGSAPTTAACWRSNDQGPACHTASGSVGSHSAADLRIGTGWPADVTLAQYFAHASMICRRFWKRSPRR